MTRLRITELPLAGLRKVTRTSHRDERGCFTRLFCARELASAGWTRPITQINHSWTRARGTVRGLHFQQPPHAETKLVICIRGVVFDVAVDLRAGSPNFLRWHGERLAANDGDALLIPEGFAHGFQTLTDDVELVYCHDHHHVPESEGVVSALDPIIAIRWPLPIGEMSVRDREAPCLRSDFAGLAP